MTALHFVDFQGMVLAVAICNCYVDTISLPHSVQLAMPLAKPTSTSGGSNDSTLTLIEGEVLLLEVYVV